MIDKDGNSRKFGFVTMQNAEDADAVVHDGDTEIDGVHVTVQRAIPKEQIGDVPRRPTRKRARHPMYDEHPYQQQAMPAHPSMYGVPPQAPPPIYPPSAYPQYAHMPPPHHAPYNPHAQPSSYPQAQGVATYSYPSTERYQYPYTVKRTGDNPDDPRNASVDVKEENVKQEQGQVGNARSVPVTSQSQQQQMHGVPPPSHSVPRYNDKGVYVAPPVHAPAQYGQYHEVPPRGGQYGATRGTVRATQTYKPY